MSPAEALLELRRLEAVPHNLAFECACSRMDVLITPEEKQTIELTKKAAEQFKAMYRTEIIVGHADELREQLRAQSANAESPEYKTALDRYLVFVANNRRVLKAWEDARIRHKTDWHKSHRIGGYQA
jgi:hypothetical protein